MELGQNVCFDNIYAVVNYLFCATSYDAAAIVYVFVTSFYVYCVCNIEIK